MTQPLEGRTILFVEDEKMIAEMMVEELMEHGAQVLGPAATVEEALALLETEGAKISGAVLDINLGTAMSTPVADELKRRRIPFLVATGYGPEGLTAEHQDVQVLVKPYRPNQLVAGVARLF